MKKIFVVLCILAVAFSVFNFNNQEETVPDENAYLEQAPGWFKHYLKLKGDENGRIPEGSLAKWVEGDKELLVFNKKSENSLTNIEEIGPTNVGGRTRSIIIDHSNPNRYLCAGVSGGIWVTENKGQSWDQVDDFVPNLSAVSIVQSPFDKDVFYYTTGESAGNSASIGGIGLFRSRDGAKSFEHLEHTMTSDFSGTWDVEHSKIYDSTIYVATRSSGLWRSTDGGDSFSRVFSSSRDIHEIITYDDTTLMIAVEGLGIYLLDENTFESTRLNGPGWPTTSYDRISFHYCEEARNVMYAQVATSNRVNLLGVYRTDDTGRTWQEVTYPPARYNQAWYDFKLSVAPSDPDFVISTAVSPTYSRDGGQTWLTMANPHADYHEITWENDNEVLIGNDGGVYRMNKLNMTTFQDLNKGLNITQYYAGHFYPTGNSFVGGTQDNGTHLSFESSPVFARINGGDGSFCAVHQQNDDIRYVSSQYLNMRRQESGGQTRNISALIRNQVGGDDGTWFINPFTINDKDGDQIYVPTPSRVYRSLDAGDTWSELTELTFGETFSVGLSNEENPIAYIGGTGSSLYRVEDAVNAEPGDEVRLWEPTNLPPRDFLGSTIGCIEVDPNERGTIYIGLTTINNRSRIWRIRNADTDSLIWDELGKGLPESLPVNWIEVDPQMSEHIIIATDNGLYSSVNGGASWQKETVIPNTAVDQIRLRESDRKLFIFTHGRGVWTADLAENPFTSVENRQEKLGVKVYPNPTSDYLKVDAHITGYKLYNGNGVMVKEGVENTIGVSTLTEGIYFLEVERDGKTSVEKVVVAR